MKTHAAKTTSPLRACRYCGHEGRCPSEMAREGKDNCLAYACKDVAACGARIRASRGVVATSGLPF
jgi:hypothetical protein